MSQVPVPPWSFSADQLSGAVREKIHRQNTIQPPHTNDTLTCIQNITGHMLGNIYLSEINDRDSFSKYLQILPTYNIDKIVTLFNRNCVCILSGIFVTQGHNEDMTWQQALSWFVQHEFCLSLHCWTVRMPCWSIRDMKEEPWRSHSSPVDPARQTSELSLGVFTGDKTEACLAV